MTPEDALTGLFGPAPPEAAQFAPAFLAQVPASEIAWIVTGLRQQFGALETVAPEGDGFRLRFERSTVPAKIFLDGAGRISGLWFGAPVPDGPIDAHVAAIKALPGDVALLVLKDGETLHAHNAERPLAVGSAAKLAILKALADAVAKGARHWTEVAELHPEWKSLPSGMLQDWPDGTPLTLGSLAHLMISISDNTATDALIRLLGRETVEAYAPHSKPFLTTREAFTLKTAETAALRTKWEMTDEAGRREILERIATRPLPPAQMLSTDPTFKAVEWFFSAEELCTLLEAVAELPSVGINPGPITPGDWQSFAYKGGSETGVLNLSSRVVGRDGVTRCVVATWNHNAALDDNLLLTPYAGLLAALAAD
ncbi:serine hydrolase [Nisaea acidiphila]|uniref:Serine hydrolase n=1 Tax=Nisaea acidiphila TaxID=1862145 RepID=A0A9J7ASM0_9PROT|nr:serine hydrolase [Nisaea acidiphila]UUX49340.1 serine hydrolase [Nisaea acidiphila]